MRESLGALMHRLSSICLILLFLCGCASHRSKVAISETVAPGDRLLILFTNPPVPELRCVVDASGDIKLPYRVKLHVAGMTLSQVGQAIPRAYHTTFYNVHMEISVMKCQD